MVETQTEFVVVTVFTYYFWDRRMRISYDPSVDALYIRLLDEPAECEVLQLNDQVAVNIGPGERVVGIEVLDASEVLQGLRDEKVELVNLAAA